MGKREDWLGRLSVTVECFSSVAVITYGPSNRGMNLAARGSLPNLYARRLCVVDSTTRLPVLNWNVCPRCWFSCCACRIFTLSKLSFASS